MTADALPWRTPYRWAIALVLASTVAAFLLMGMAARATMAGYATGRRVYTLVQLDDGLAQQPGAWLHRTLRVRALLGGACTQITGLYTATCSGWELALTDPDPAGDVAPLPLAWGKAPALLAFLRRLPLLRQLVPPPQLLHSSVPAVYWIQLQPTACVLSANPACYEALLLDAIPPNNSTNWVRIGS